MAPKGLRCPDCLTENPLGTFYCASCASPLLPFEMIPARDVSDAADVSLLPDSEPHDTPSFDTEFEDEQAIAAVGAQQRFRIVLGDTCPVCRAAAQISFTAARPPQIPLAGCRDPAGCRCRLPAMASGEASARSRARRQAAPDVIEAAPEGPLLQHGPFLYDEKTGAFGREAIEAFGNAIVNEAMRRGLPLAILLLRLGTLTDRLDVEPTGRDAEALQRLFEIIRGTIRASDLVGRYDARTFAVVAQGAEEGGATQIVERILAMLSEQAKSIGVPVPRVRHGAAILPTGGTTLGELLQTAIDPLEPAAGGRRRSRSADSLAAAERQEAELGPLLEEFERGAISGITIRTEPGVCPVCRDAARDAYRPPNVPALPLIGCSGRDGCRCHYGPAAAATRSGPPPLQRLQSPLDIPPAWHAAALFGQDPKQSCRPQDLAAYLDAFAPLPFHVDLPLQPGEAAYLLRQGRRGRDEGRMGELASMPQFPLQGSLAAWTASNPKPPQVRVDRLDFWDVGLVCLTNWRIIFGRRGAIESVMLADVTAIGYVRGGFCCTAGPRSRQTVFLVPDALQVGLCVDRAVRDAIVAASQHRLASAG